MSNMVNKMPLFNKNVDEFNSKTVGSLAILNVNWQDGNDYMDIFMPFIATLIKKNYYSQIEIEVICNDFEKEFGLTIPYYPMQTILNCARKHGLIEKSQGGYYIPKNDKIRELDFSQSARQQITKQQKVINEFVNFVKENYEVEFSKKEAEVAFLTFLKEHGLDLFDNNNKLFLSKTRQLQDRQKKYFINKYIAYTYENEPIIYKFIVDTAIGYILASAITYNEFDNYKGRLEGIDYYLDTRFILRLIGLEGKIREEAYREFVQTLAEEKANLFIFSHTYDELLDIIMECEKWISDIRYDPSKASPVLKYFIENQYTKHEISSLVVNIEEILKKLNITIVSTPEPNIYKQYQIDEEQLYNVIVDVYNSSNPDFDEIKNKKAIYKDIKSISAIYKIREGKEPKKIENARTIFITTNRGLAYANKLYETKILDNKYTIPACLTDIFIGTITWLRLPAKISKLNEKKIIADCYAALQPDDLLLKKFVNEVEKLNKRGKINNDECYLLKTFKTSMTLLGEKTLGDPNQFTDQTVEEILSDIKSEIRLEEREKYYSEKKELLDTINELSCANEDKQCLENNMNNFNKNIEKLSSIISKLGAWIIFSISCIFIVFSLSIQIYPNIIGNSLVKNLSLLFGLICGIANLIFGCNLNGIKFKVYQWVKMKVYNILIKLIN